MSESTPETPKTERPEVWLEGHRFTSDWAEWSQLVNSVVEVAKRPIVVGGSHCIAQQQSHLIEVQPFGI